jgi:CubicO group peptidase (beta-lactamase class C family)
MDADFAKLVLEALDEFAVPGCAVGIVHGDTDDTSGFGVANVETGLPFSADTIVPLASITKTYTATAVMLLRDQGKLDIDATVKTYIPGFRMQDDDVTNNCTLRHLLTHSGGFVGEIDFESTERGDGVLEDAVVHIGDAKQLTPLGATWAYSNAGFVLLGRIIEIVTGQTYESAIRDLILGPLGMDRSFFFEEEAIAYPVAVGHHASEEGQVPSRRWKFPRIANPAGGLASTVTDQLKFVRFHLNGGDTLADMSRVHIEAGNVCDAGGLGMMLHRRDGALLSGHGGSGDGIETLEFFVPGRDFGIVVLTNSYPGGLGLHKHVMDAALERYLGIPPRVFAPIDVPAEESAPFIGRYDYGTGEEEQHVWVGPSNGTVSVEISGSLEDGAPRLGLPVSFHAPGELIIVDGPFSGYRAEFVKDRDGTLLGLRFGGRMLVRADGATRLPPRE